MSAATRLASAQRASREAQDALSTAKRIRHQVLESLSSGNSGPTTVATSLGAYVAQFSRICALEELVDALRTIEADRKAEAEAEAAEEKARRERENSPQAIAARKEEEERKAFRAMHDANLIVMGELARFIRDHRHDGRTLHLPPVAMTIEIAQLALASFVRMGNREEDEPVFFANDPLAVRDWAARNAKAFVELGLLEFERQLKGAQGQRHLVGGAAPAMVRVG